MGANYRGFYPRPSALLAVFLSRSLCYVWAHMNNDRKGEEILNSHKNERRLFMRQSWLSVMHLKEK